MTKVLVTGANGMLGQDLCPILEDEGYDVIETDIKNLDITNKDEVFEYISNAKPDIIIHAAAYTNVDKAEEEPDKAHLINVTGTDNISKAAEKVGATIIYISTDYVFDGTKNCPYEPDDTPNPLNKYGLTKFEGEKAVIKNCTKYYITRTSWLYGIHGKNFVETMISLKDKSDLKVVNDQEGCPTWTIELANGIVDLLEDKEPYGIYHICGGGSTTWYGFASEVINNAKPCTTEEFPRPAKRPKYSVMNNHGRCRDWQTALKDYMKLRNFEEVSV